MTVEPFSLALAHPLENAAGTIERREGFVVRLEVDGVEGVGEATPLPGWTESVDACRAALERALDRKRNEPDSPGETPDPTARPDPTATPDLTARPDPMATPAAAHGIELALLDARARGAAIPLHRALTGDDDARPPERLPVNATVGDADAVGTATAAERAGEAGFGALKVKVGARSVDEDAERVAAVRDAVGPDVELRADANGAWSRDDARAALDRFAESDVAYVEQPLRADDLAGLAALRGGPVGVAIDESLSVHAVRNVLEADAADVLVLKAMVLGGPARAVAAAGEAREAGVMPVVTTTVDAVHARTAAIHVAAALADPPACGLATADRLSEDLGPDPAPVEDGGVRVPRGPGNLGDPA